MSWKLVEIASFLKERKGRFNPDDKEIQDLQRIEKIDFSGKIFLSEKSSKTNMIIIKNGDLVISGINVEKGAMAIYDGKKDVKATIHYSSYEYDKDKIDILFLSHFLKSLTFKNALKEQVPGGIKTEIKPKHILPLKVYIPTELKEQKLVVEILDKRNESVDLISTQLSHQLSLVKKLRQSFLREAMQGRFDFAQQPDANEETGAELLAKIKAEKALRQAQGQIRKQKPLPPIRKEEIPFEIPENWVWCRLGEICDTITKGSSPKWQGVKYVNSINEGILFITSKNVDSYKIDLSNSTFVEEKFNEIEPRSILQKGDILTNIVGASIGRTAIYDLDYNANINQAVCILRYEHNFFLKEYLLKLMNSNFIIELMLEMQFSPGRANLSMSNLSKFPIALPPLSEQKRIVAKLDELMAYCDSLEASIKNSQIQNEMLLGQVLREALEPKEKEVVV